jgi:DNA-binding response OmpR family regulator
MAKHKILLAEDELALGTIVKESLETRDFEVIFCEDGEVAFKNYELHQPELLVLDVMMPKKMVLPWLRKFERKTLQFRSFSLLRNQEQKTW